MADFIKIKFKRGEKSALETKLVGDNKLAYGEPAFEKDTGKLKIGDGEHDYDDLGYIGGDDSIFAIQDPEDGQILTYDSTTGKWVNKSFAETIPGFDAALDGQMPVKKIGESGEEDSIVWETPVSRDEISGYVEAARESAAQAQTYSNDAGNSAGDAATSAAAASASFDKIKEYVEGKFWWGTLDEYNDIKSLNPGTFYFIIPAD